MCSQVDRVLPPRSFLARALEHALRRLAVRAELSPRECAVLRLIARGYSYSGIGRALGIQPRTVKMHACSLRAKTGAGSRQALVGLLYAG